MTISHPGRAGLVPCIRQPFVHPSAGRSFEFKPETPIFRACLFSRSTEYWNRSAALLLLPFCGAHGDVSICLCACISRMFPVIFFSYPNISELLPNSFSGITFALQCAHVHEAAEGAPRFLALFIRSLLFFPFRATAGGANADSKVHPSEKGKKYTQKTYPPSRNNWIMFVYMQTRIIMAQRKPRTARAEESQCGTTLLCTGVCVCG